MIRRYLQWFQKREIEKSLLTFMLDKRHYLERTEDTVDLGLANLLAFDEFQIGVGELIENLSRRLHPDAIGAKGKRAEIIASAAADIFMPKLNIVFVQDRPPYNCEEITEEIVTNKKIIVVATFFNDFLKQAVKECQRKGYEVVAAISIFGWENEKENFAKLFGGKFPIFCLFSMNKLVLQFFSEDEKEKKRKKSPFVSKKSYLTPRV